MSIHTPFGLLKSCSPVPGIREAAPYPADAIIPPMHPNASSAHILIVDSDPIACAKLGAWFSHQGHTVALACTHDMADALLRNVTFNLIVCDHAAPNPAARKWIDHLLVKTPCPMILVATHPTLELAIRTANLAVSGYLPKPVDLAELGQLVTRILPHAG